MVVSHSVKPVTQAVPDVIRQAWRVSPMLVLFIVANVGVFVTALVGLVSDPRLILGASVWAKTLKFSISFVIYGATLVWMLSYVKTRPRAAQVIGFATSLTLLVEAAVIALQALRGQASHFNQSTPFDTMLFQVMGISIGIFYLFNIVGGVLIAFERFANPVLGLGIKLGIGMALIGFGLGFLMTGETTSQTAVLTRGGSLDYIGAHNVGALVDGATRMIPILGWNMDGGDLRIPHFVGMHGAQVIPLLAAIVMWLGARGLSTTRQRALVVIGAAFYFGLTMLVTWQATRNESIVAPGASTLAALASLCLIALAGAAVVTRMRRK